MNHDRRYFFNGKEGDVRMDKIQEIAKIAQCNHKQVQAVISLLEDGNTVPFIARYRKEATGSLDEVAIKKIEDTYRYLTNLEERKQEVFRLITEQEKMTKELQQQLVQAKTLQAVEDIYRPYKQKRRTRATIAIEKGLNAFAEAMLTGEATETYAANFISEEKEVLSIEDVYAGARDILAEQITDQKEARDVARKLSWSMGKLTTIKKKDAVDDKSIYEMYYDYEEPLSKIVPHRTLAINRGEKENILRVTVEFPTERIIEKIAYPYLKKSNADELETAIEDGVKRLLLPSIEREIRNELTEKAESQAIRVFGENLKSLLLQPPLKGNVVLSLDPAFRTGCKVAVIDKSGKLEKVDVIYPHPPQSKIKEAEEKIAELVKQYQVKIIAIGNGTASRETEQFVANCLSKGLLESPYVIVNEAGASVYSASEEAREEFPDLQVEQRSAVSIARRIQDPLSELVKIDPASIGVGQYQHDVSKRELESSLHFIVESAVNRVGVNVNTASASLLQYVSGISKVVAQNIVKYREEHGDFQSRKELKKVPRFGPKTYEQAVGFLRVYGGNEVFDQTGIHPESYNEATQLLEKLSITKKEIGSDRVREALESIDTTLLAESLKVGRETLIDIIDILQRPNRDPRDEFPQPLLKSDVLSIKDLHQGMKLQGTVRNVVDFGAFVDIGVTEDGLVHISKLSNRFVRHPLDVVSSGDIVTVWVDSVDQQKQRIGLTMIEPK